MQQRLQEILRCPLTRQVLRLEVFSEEQKEYSGVACREVKDGMLYSPAGFMFPIIDGIPRMLIEAFEDYKVWISKHIPDYANRAANLHTTYHGLIRYCRNKNKRTKKSFALEWSLLDYGKKDKVWHDDELGLESLFFNEADENQQSMKGKSVIDVGCGHGLNARAVAAHCNFVVGADLGKSIENAYKFNDRENVFFVQADLEFLPFAAQSFDILLSGGVLHHTKNTELALSKVEPLIKTEGKLCIWLYHPQKSIVHNVLNTFRRFSSLFPVKAQFLFYLIHVFPITFTIKKIKGRKHNWREEMIDLMDTLSPYYRHEHTEDEAMAWLAVRSYGGVKITTQGQYGFSVIGIKNLS